MTQCLALVAAGVVCVLSACPAHAQPLFHCEHDWTIDVGGRLYGVRDIVQRPGEFRWTQIWIASHDFEPERQPEDWSILALPPVAGLLSFRTMFLQVATWMDGA